MESTPASLAMKWSIHLDKSLRSNNPVKQTEAIKETGAKLEWWSKEPELSMSEFDMFNLLPGEDKLFANSILLKLTDAFTSGHKHIKLSVVHVFLSELKHRKINNYNTKNKGILSKYKVENHLELLMRVKTCFISGDVYVKALALVLFGCWSDFAKDNADIRYLILSSIVSSHVLEVKASLFAAGCFCEFSDDFARVLLEMLVNMISSSDVSIGNRLAGVRAFAKLGGSSAVSRRAYEEGKKLVLGSVEDDIVTTMLISLSIIASRSALVLPRQVDLLLSFLSHDKSLALRATSLRCLHIILSRSRFRFSPSIELINAMFNMLNGELSPVMQNDVLHILYELVVSKMLSFSCSEINEYFTKISTVVENVMQSPFISNRLFVTHFLADISVKFTRRRGVAYEGYDKSPASETISFLMARVTFLVNSVLKLNQSDIKVEKEIWSLLKTISHILHVCPNVSEFALHKIYLFINCLVNKDEGVLALDWSKLVVRVSRVVVLCLQNLVKTGTLTSEIQNVVRLLIKDICECSFLYYYVQIIYYLLLHPFTSHWDFPYVINNEHFALEKAKKLMEVKDYWSAYKAGKYAVLQGAWFTAAFIFGELTTMVCSDSCHQWLTSLTLFAYSEMKIMYCGLPKERSILLDWLVNSRSSSLPIIGVLGDIGKTTNQEIENLGEVCRTLMISKEMLANDVTPSGKHYFQIQFLSLRANVIEIVVNIFKLLSTIPVSNGQNEHLVHSLTQLSTRLMKLARHYDLLATSFIGVDPTSTRIISSHALSCSVLAFVSGFLLVFANRDFQKLGLHAMLIHDLVGRIWHLDREVSNELVLLLETCFGESKSCSSPQFKTQRLENTDEVRGIIQICRFAVKGVVSLQNAAKRMHEDDNKIQLQIVNDGTKLQLDVLRNWLNISLRIPTYFFSVKSCVSCHLFAMNRDSGNGGKISVLPGYLLHLDLCLQLNDILPESRLRITKLYCILQTQTCHHGVDDNILELNDKLVKYLNKCEKDDTSNGQNAETIVCFKPNGKGQGFSTCMLDVSAFPLGSYEIKWRAGCLDIDGCYWGLNSINSGPVFTVQKPC